MMKIKIEKILRLMLILWGVYLLFEATLYFFNIRMQDVKNIWPEISLTYIVLIEKVLGSLMVLVALLTFELQRNLEKYKTILKLGAIWALFHGGLLIFLALSQNYYHTFLIYPSLFVWFPYYDFYVILEGVVLLIFSAGVFLWLKNEK